MVFSPPIGYKTIKAQKSEVHNSDGSVVKTVVITSTMPTSYPSPFDAAPTTVKSKGLTITQQESINGNVVIQKYIYTAIDPIWMP